MRTRRRVTKKMVYDNAKKIIIPLLVIIFLCIIGIVIKYFKEEKNNVVYVVATIDVNEILDKIKKEKQEEERDTGLRVEEVVREYDLEYKTIYEEDSTLPKGMMQVSQEGRTGKVEVLIKQTYKDLELISEEQVSNKLVKVPIDKVVITGTSKYKSNYKVKARRKDVCYAKYTRNKRIKR